MDLMPEGDADDDFHSPEFIEVRLSDPQTEGSGFWGKYTTYKVSTKTSIPQYQEEDFFVRRRFQDFIWLHRTLQIRYKDIVMPSLPPAKFNGRFNDAFIRARMSALEDFVNWVAQHPITRADPIVTVFLEQPEGESNQP